jgi:hypothetical protein
MDEDRLDLRALDPTADARRWEGLIWAINARAAVVLARRAAGVGGAGVLGVLGRWAWPAVAAAAVMAAISGATLNTAARPADPLAPVFGTVIEALDVRGPVALWLAEERAPTVADVVLALEEDSR